MNGTNALRSVLVVPTEVQFFTSGRTKQFLSNWLSDWALFLAIFTLSFATGPFDVKWTGSLPIRMRYLAQSVIRFFISFRNTAVLSESSAHRKSNLIPINATHCSLQWVTFWNDFLFLRNIFLLTVWFYFKDLSDPYTSLIEVFLFISMLDFFSDHGSAHQKSNLISSALGVFQKNLRHRAVSNLARQFWNNNLPYVWEVGWWRGCWLSKVSRRVL